MLYILTCICISLDLSVGFPGSSAGKESICNAGAPVRFLGQEDPLEKGSTPVFWASLVAQTVKNMPAMRDPWVGKIHWRKEWLPTPSISYINHNILHFHQQQMRVLVAYQHLVLAVVPDLGHSRRRVVVCHCFSLNLHFPNDV